MGGNKEQLEVDNIYAMDAVSAIKLIKSFFEVELPFFILSKEYCKLSGHWGVEFKAINSEIFIHSNRGFLEMSVKKNESELDLKKFERDIEFIKISSKKNISIVLKVIKILFSE